MQTVNVQIPFSGFYGSYWESEFDNAQEMDQYNLDQECKPGAEYSRWEDWLERIPALRAYPAEFAWQTMVESYGNAIFMATDYGAAYRQCAQAWAEYFLSEIGAAGSFEQMTSPREYNFQIDRIFCDISAEFMESALAELLASDESAAIYRQHIERRHSSRSGFISFYSADWQDWRGLGISEMDHNQLATVLQAWLELREFNWREMESDCQESLSGNGYFDNWLWEACDLERLNSEIRESLETRVTDWIEKDSESVKYWIAANGESFGKDSELPAELVALMDEIQESRPYRCPYTLDMFA